MAWYPFDLQRCELLLKPFGNTGEYVYLVNTGFNYLDKMDLSKYYIKQWKFESINKGMAVEGKSEMFQMYLVMNNGMEVALIIDWQRM